MGDECESAISKRLHRRHLFLDFVPSADLAGGEISICIPYACKWSYLIVFKCWRALKGIFPADLSEKINNHDLALACLGIYTDSKVWCFQECSWYIQMCSCCNYQTGNICSSKILMCVCVFFVCFFFVFRKEILDHQKYFKGIFSLICL